MLGFGCFGNLFRNRGHCGGQRIFGWIGGNVGSVPRKTHSIDQNKENLGGAGGFNTGLREVPRENYKYVHLFDSDVIVHQGTFRNSYDLLEKEPSIGAVGSMLYQLDAPETWQEMEAKIDWSTCHVKPLHSGIPDSPALPEFVESDCVPASFVGKGPNFKGTDFLYGKV